MPNITHFFCVVCLCFLPVSTSFSIEMSQSGLLTPRYKVKAEDKMNPDFDTFNALLKQIDLKFPPLQLDLQGFHLEIFNLSCSDFGLGALNLLSHNTDIQLFRQGLKLKIFFSIVKQILDIKLFYFSKGVALL